MPLGLGNTLALEENLLLSPKLFKTFTFRNPRLGYREEPAPSQSKRLTQWYSVCEEERHALVPGVSDPLNQSLSFPVPHFLHTSYFQRALCGLFLFLPISFHSWEKKWKQNDLKGKKKYLFLEATYITLWCNLEEFLRKYKDVYRIFAWLNRSSHLWKPGVLAVCMQGKWSDMEKKKQIWTHRYFLPFSPRTLFVSWMHMSRILIITQWVLLRGIASPSSKLPCVVCETFSSVTCRSLQEVSEDWNQSHIKPLEAALRISLLPSKYFSFFSSFGLIFILSV